MGSPRVVIFPNSDDVAEFAARQLTARVQQKPNTVLGLATGATPLNLYRKLVERYRQRQLSFKQVTTFNLDEYLGIKPQNSASYRYYMNRHLFDHVDIDIGNTHVPSCPDVKLVTQVCNDYETLIESRGGIDFQILGIGRNGHIGFNEPGSRVTSRTRPVPLSASTTNANKAYFATRASMPSHAITTGIATIIEARHILLLATGEQKACAVAAALENQPSVECPASVLQNHPSVTFVADERAASLLKRYQLKTSG